LRKSVGGQSSDFVIQQSKNRKWNNNKINKMDVMENTHRPTHANIDRRLELGSTDLNVQANIGSI